MLGMMGLHKAYKFTESELHWQKIPELSVKNVKGSVENVFPSKAQQQVTDMRFLAQGNQ